MLQALILAAVAGGCPADHARYDLRAAPGVTAQFHPVAADRDWPGGLVLEVHFAASGRSYWLLPWRGGTDDLQNVTFVGDPATPGWRLPSPDGPGRRGDIEYVATDAAYDVIDDIPQAGGEAPAHILLPALGDVVWHGDVARRDSAPKQFFDLAGCD